MPVPPCQGRQHRVCGADQDDVEGIGGGTAVAAEGATGQLFEPAPQGWLFQILLATGGQQVLPVDPLEIRAQPRHLDQKGESTDLALPWGHKFDVGVLEPFIAVGEHVAADHAPRFHRLRQIQAP